MQGSTTPAKRPRMAHHVFVGKHSGLLGIQPRHPARTAQSGRRDPREQVFQVPHYLAAIRSVDEAVVIGVALSLSSSAFVLQLLTERGELTTKFGSATLGILLAQVSVTCHVAAPWMSDVCPSQPCRQQPWSA